VSEGTNPEIYPPCYELSALHYLAGVGCQRGFRQWLQLVHCTNLLFVGSSISIVSVHSSELNQN